MWQTIPCSEQNVLLETDKYIWEKKLQAVNVSRMNERKHQQLHIKLHVCFNVSVSQLVSLLFVSCTCVSIHWPVCYVGQNILTDFRKRWRMWRRGRRWTWTGTKIQNKQPFAESEIVLFPLGFPFSDVIKYIGNTSALCTLSMLNLLFLLK